MKKIVLVGIALALFGCSGGHPAYAAAVYPGCSAPPQSTGKTWYIDPVNGATQKAGADGSQAHPWNSLKAVVGTKINGIFGPDVGYAHPLLSSVKGSVGPVQPGDTIILMSGNYGDIAIGDFNMEIVNPSFVTVEAGAGQTPVLDTLLVTRTNKWVFQGVKVQSIVGTNGSTAPLVVVGDQGASFPTTDIVFQGMDLSSADDTVTAAWTQAQQIAQARNGFSLVSSAGTGTNGDPNTTCVSMTGSHIHSVRFGAYLFANNSLFSGNEVDHFGDDGLDFGANNLAITQNKVHDSFTTANGIHTDAMQGQTGPLAPGVAYNKFSNILIDSNMIIRQLDPALKFPGYLQGIDAFDEDWTNMTVTNNVIITSSCYSIDLGSIHDSLIAGNTGADDGQIPTPGCTTMMIAGGKTHEGPVSTNTRVTSNLADRFVIGGAGDTGLTYDNNVATNSNEPFGHEDVATQTFVFSTPPGTDANGNLSFAKALDLTKVFKVWSPATFTYDLHLIAGSPAIGKGVGIPALDITGAVRVPPVPPLTAGAYAPSN